MTSKGGKASAKQSLPEATQRGFYSDVVTQEAENLLDVSNSDFLF